MDIAKLYEFLQKYGIDGVIILILFLVLISAIRIILDEDKSSLWRSRFYKILFYISNKQSHEKKYLSNDIKGKLNLARRNIHYGTDTIPQLNSIEWVEGGMADSYEMSDDEYVIRLDPAKCQHENIVRMAETVVKHTALIGVRHLVSRPIADSIDFTMTKKLLTHAGNKRAVDHFYSSVYSAGASNPDFSEWNKRIVRIDEYGLFERLMIVELESFARSVYGMAPRSYMVGNVEYFVKWLYRIATRKEREDVPLNYYKTHISVGLVLVAKVATLRDEGTAPYLAAVNIHLTKGARTIYLIMWDRPSLTDWRSYKKLCNNLVREIKINSVLDHHFTDHYEYVDSEGNKQSGSISRFVKSSEIA